MKEKQRPLFDEDLAEQQFALHYERRGLDEKVVAIFRELVYEFYRRNSRPMPWRETDDPYAILVSEIMLQQTQVDRVREKYVAFLAVYPDFRRLAAANFRELLALWQGLGYNRRALLLKACAERVVADFGGELPADETALRSLPGIGAYTAGAIMAFAFRKPVLFVETNIRTVYIHFFFGDESGVTDADIAPFLERTLDTRNPREWYYALMDYGVHLKKKHKNPGRRSAHHVRQSPFEGSRRQLRGRVLKAVIEEPRTAYALARRLKADGTVLQDVLDELGAEGFIVFEDGRYRVR